MTVIKACVIPPEIQNFYDSLLLDPFLRILISAQNVEKYSYRKIRTQDNGKRRLFDKLYKEFLELYERKKIEKEEYEEKIKNSPKRPCIPNTGKTMRFKKFRS